MLTCLFWNVNRSDCRVPAANLVREHAVDLLVMVECAIAPSDIVAALGDAGVSGFASPPRLAGRGGPIQLFIRGADARLQDVSDNPVERFTIRRLVFERAPDLLLAVAHLPSKLHADSDDQTSRAAKLARALEFEEGRLNHTRSILVGDLNMHPFDGGVVNADGLHAVMTREIAASGGGGRKVAHERRKFFYNPMWRLYGSRGSDPPGTFYRPPSGQRAYFWHMYDQVLVRPALADALTDVRIIHRVGTQSLLTERGRPDRRVGSDHLPLLFTLTCGQGSQS